LLGFLHLPKNNANYSLMDPTNIIIIIKVEYGAVG